VYTNSPTAAVPTPCHAQGAFAQCHAPCADKEVVIQTNDLQCQNVRRNFYDLAQIPFPQPWSG